MPAGDDTAPVLVGTPAELALMRIAAVFTEALGLEVSCSSCACSRYVPGDRSLACVSRVQGLAADIGIAASFHQVRRLMEELSDYICLTIMLVSRRWACQTLYTAPT